MGGKIKCYAYCITVLLCFTFYFVYTSALKPKQCMPQNQLLKQSILGTRTLKTKMDTIRISWAFILDYTAVLNLC